MSTNPSDAITIRHANFADCDDVIMLWQACGLTVPWNDPVQDFNRKMNYQADFFLVANSSSGEIVGSVMGGYDGHRGSMNYMAVSPSFRRLGVGRSLVDALSLVLAKAGCPRLKLMVRQADKDSANFLTSVDFVQDDVLAFGRRLITD